MIRAHIEVDLCFRWPLKMDSHRRSSFSWIFWSKTSRFRSLTLRAIKLNTKQRSTLFTKKFRRHPKTEDIKKILISKTSIISSKILLRKTKNSLPNLSSRNSMTKWRSNFSQTQMVSFKLIWDNLLTQTEISLKPFRSMQTFQKMMRFLIEIVLKFREILSKMRWTTS